MRARLLAAVLVAAFGGCGLPMEGTGSPGDVPGMGEQRAPGATVDGGEATDRQDAYSAEASTNPQDASTCTCDTPPAQGWHAVDFAGDRATACPGDTSTLELVENPSAQADACSCGACAVTSSPSCTGGTWGSVYDQGGSAACDTSSSVTHAGNNGACSQYSNYLAAHSKLVPPTPSGAGTCTSTGVGNAAKVQSTSVRACAAGASCACPQPAQGFAACWMADGDLACPGGFPSKHTVGTSATLSCSACPCTVTATCSGTATFYSDNNCNTAVATVSTATCSATNGVSYDSYKWQGTTNTQCSLGASTPSVALTGVATVCCP